MSEQVSERKRLKGDSKWKFTIKHSVLESGGQRAMRLPVASYRTCMWPGPLWILYDFQIFIPSFWYTHEKLWVSGCSAGTCIYSIHWATLEFVHSHIPYIRLFLFIVGLYKKWQSKKKMAEVLLFSFLFRFVAALMLYARERREVLFRDCEVCCSGRIWDENTEKALEENHRIASHKMAARIFHTRLGHLWMTRTMNMHFA